MRLARLATPEGVVSGRLADGVLHTDDGQETLEVGVDGTLTVPTTPSAIYCVGRNYAETIDLMGYERPEEPDFFIKPPVSLLAHEEPISYPDFTEELKYAGELAAVIDEPARDLRPAAVPDVVRGYCVLNDLDALDQGSLTPRKAFDHAAPLGPWIETDVDPCNLEMWTDVSGERRQSANTSQMLFDPYEVIAHLSRRVTLQPGDVVSFGSPANPGFLAVDDVVEITYEGVGTLRNHVVERSEAHESLLERQFA